MKLSIEIKKEYTRVDDLQIVYSGENYFTILRQLIGSAQERIHFQTYIFDGDETGELIANSLIAASLRGVQIFLLVDAFGSKNLPSELIRRMTDAGIHLRFFAPFSMIKNLRVGRRLHHKVITVDSKTSLVGGINIANKYHGDSKNTPWLDYAILVKGKLCADLNEICERIYFKKFHRKKKLSHHNGDNHLLARIRQNDHLRGKQQINRSYIKAIRSAQHTIHISGSYFLPGLVFRKELARASRRGVEVKLILAGVSDVPVFNSATRWLYDYLLRNKIKLYEWKESVLHGKAAVIDGVWLTIGSYNINHLSAAGSLELNVDVIDGKLAEELTLHFDSIIKTGCNEINPEKLNRSLLARFGRWLAYQSTRIFLKLLAIFPKSSFYNKDE